MRKQSGTSALKLILIIALGILMAGFIGCVGSLVFTGAVVTGVATAITQKQTAIPATTYNTEERQKQAMAKFAQEQKQIQLNRPIEPAQSYIEMNGKRITIPKQTPTPELTRQDYIDYRKKTGRY